VSLIDQAQELESVADADLIRMAGMPDGRYPPFLIISEMQRRKKIRAAYQADLSKMEMPTQSIAEREIMEFSQGAMPSQPRVSSSSNSGLTSIAPNPMMRAAGGGLMRMQFGSVLPFADMNTEEYLKYGFRPKVFTEGVYSAKNPDNPDEFKDLYNAFSRILSGEFGKSDYATYGGTKRFFGGIKDVDRIADALGIDIDNLNRQEAGELLRKTLLENYQGNTTGSSGSIDIDDSSQVGGLPVLDGQFTISDPNTFEDSQGLSAKKSVADRIKEYEEAMDFTKVSPEELTDEDVSKRLQTEGLLSLAGAISSGKNLSEVASGIAEAGKDILAERERLETKQLEGAAARRAQELEERGLAIKLIELDIAADASDKSSDAQFFALVNTAIGEIMSAPPSARSFGIGILEQAFKVRGFPIPGFIKELETEGLPGQK
jgi:hypothetical protein